MNEFEKENKYLRAKKQVAAIKKFYTSLLFYLVVIIFLAGLNYYKNEWSNPWFLWAVFGWGIGILFKAFKVFRYMPFVNKNWEERKIKEFMDNDNEPVDNRWN